MKLYIGIITSVSLALSICVLLISIMHSVNQAHYLIIISFLLFGFAATSVFRTFTVPPANIYASL